MIFESCTRVNSRVPVLLVHVIMLILKLAMLKSDELAVLGSRSHVCENCSL